MLRPFLALVVSTCNYMPAQSEASAQLWLISAIDWGIDPRIAMLRPEHHAACDPRPDQAATLT